MNISRFNIALARFSSFFEFDNFYVTFIFQAICNSELVLMNILF